MHASSVFPPLSITRMSPFLGSSYGFKKDIYASMVACRDSCTCYATPRQETMNIFWSYTSRYAEPDARVENERR